MLNPYVLGTQHLMPVPALKALVTGDRQQINTRRWVLTTKEKDKPGKRGGEEGGWGASRDRDGSLIM